MDSFQKFVMLALVLYCWSIRRGLATKVEQTTCATEADRQALAMQLATTLVDSDGVTITSATIVGDCSQFGIFTEGNSVTQQVLDEGKATNTFIDQGITLSTGRVAMAELASNEQNDGGSFNDFIHGNCLPAGPNMNDDVPELFAEVCATAPSCTVLCDAAELEFTFELVGNAAVNVSVNYIFASEEYNENSGFVEQAVDSTTREMVLFADSFGFFLDGQNIARANDGSVVSIATINRQNDFLEDAQGNSPYPAHNEEQFVDNDIHSINGCVLGPLAGDYNTEFDGFTTVLRAGPVTIEAQCPKVHTMRFSVADSNDAAINTQVFIQSKTFSTSLVGCMDPLALNHDGFAVKESGQCVYKSGDVLTDDFVAVAIGNVTACQDVSIEWLENSNRRGLEAAVSIDLCDLEDADAECIELASAIPSLNCDPRNHRCEGWVWSSVGASQTDKEHRYRLRMNATYTPYSEPNVATTDVTITLPAPPITVIVPASEDGAERDAGVCDEEDWYLHCPAYIKYTSTVAEDLRIMACEVNGSSSCSLVHSETTVAGSYNVHKFVVGENVDDFDASDMAVGKSYGLELEVDCYFKESSAERTVRQYDSNTLNVTAPRAGDLLFACGTYDVRWDVAATGGPVRGSSFDVALYDSAGALRKTIGTGITVGAVEFVVGPDLEAGEYEVIVSSTSYSSDCVPDASVRFYISQDQLEDIVVDAGEDMDENVAGIQWRMCKTYYVDVSFGSRVGDVELLLVDEELVGDPEAGVRKRLTSSGLVSHFTSPTQTVAGHTYSVVVSPADPALAQCIPAVTKSLFVVPTAVENVKANYNSSWSEVCADEGEADYSVSWDLSVLEYVDVELCHRGAVNSSECATCHDWESGKCSHLVSDLAIASTHIAGDELWSNDLYLARGPGEYVIRVAVSSDEGCVQAGQVNVTLSDERDHGVCPEESTASVGASEALETEQLIGLIVIVLFLLLVATVLIYCYAKYKMNETEQKAEDVMMAQEERFEQNREFDGISGDVELPMVCSLTVTNPISNDVEALQKENAMLRDKIAALKRREEVALLGKASEPRVGALVPKSAKAFDPDLCAEKRVRK